MTDKKDNTISGNIIITSGGSSIVSSGKIFEGSSSSYVLIHPKEQAHQHFINMCFGVHNNEGKDLELSIISPISNNDNYYADILNRKYKGFRYTKPVVGSKLSPLIANYDFSMWDERKSLANLPNFQTDLKNDFRFFNRGDAISSIIIRSKVPMKQLLLNYDLLCMENLHLELISSEKDEYTYSIKEINFYQQLGLADRTIPLTYPYSTITSVPVTPVLLQFPRNISKEQLIDITITYCNWNTNQRKELTEKTFELTKYFRKETINSRILGSIDKKISSAVKNDFSPTANNLSKEPELPRSSQPSIDYPFLNNGTKTMEEKFKEHNITGKEVTLGEYKGFNLNTFDSVSQCIPIAYGYDYCLDRQTFNINMNKPSDHYDQKERKLSICKYADTITKITFKCKETQGATVPSLIQIFLDIRLNDTRRNQLTLVETENKNELLVKEITLEKQFGITDKTYDWFFLVFPENHNILSVEIEYCFWNKKVRENLLACSTVGRGDNYVRPPNFKYLSSFGQI